LVSNVALTLLGPVDVRLNGQAVDIGYPRQRCTLAALLVDANRVVALDTLAARLWGEDVPRSARNVIAGYVSRLRQALSGTGDVQLVRRSGGYAALVEPELVDLHRFRRLVAVAGTVDDAQRVASYEQALALWQGSALDGLPGEWCATTREALSRERLAAMLAYHDTLLRLGRHVETLPRLHALAVEHPLDERIAGRLMLAAYRSGDQAAAIESYQQIRTRLAEELGVDPAPHLRELYQQLLCNDPALAPPRQQASTVPRKMAHWQPPGQLPLDVAGFTGRTAELAGLDELLDSVGRHPTAVVVAALSGTAGVGKTALAVHWAHRVADLFPDGQLYVNLRGFDPGGSTVAPAAAVRRFVEAFGIAPARVPAGLDARVDLYRSLLAGKRVLVVIDNAATVEQVRPLLPGAPGCLVLVTSRTTFTGLVAVEGARPIVLDLLTDDEAYALLSERLGAGRLAAEPAATAEIINGCARLPLALAVAAARAATRPGMPLGVLAEHLRDVQARLNTLAGDEPHTDVRAVFSWSYQSLTPPAAELFRFLGAHPGPDISAPAAASLAGRPLPQVRSLLTELVRANLLTEHMPGRYACHDLLHAYAAELIGESEYDESRRAAVGRMLDHYLHTVHRADQLASQRKEPIILGAPRPGVVPEQHDDRQSAVAWWTAESSVLLAVVERSVEAGYDVHTWQLAWLLQGFLNRQARWPDIASIARVGLAAATRLGDPDALIHMSRLIALAEIQLGRLEEAYDHLQRALKLCRWHGDINAQAGVHIWIGDAYVRQGRHREALQHDRLSLELYRIVGNETGQASALNGIGWCHMQLGDLEEALGACGQALTLFQSLDDRYGEASAWDSLGAAHHRLGHHTRAIECYQHALDRCRNIGDRFHEAIALDHIGDVHNTAGDRYAAKGAWRLALTALGELDHPMVNQVRAKLDERATA
jgi:DNA-binding SARP family transcriptional activator/tetratricopeptide (TPR) repeat protein